MYMKKTADIFAEEKAYLLDKKWIGSQNGLILQKLYVNIQTPEKNL